MNAEDNKPCTCKVPVERHLYENVCDVCRICITRDKHHTLAECIKILEESRHRRDEQEFENVNLRMKIFTLKEENEALKEAKGGSPAQAGNGPGCVRRGYSRIRGRC